MITQISPTKVRDGMPKKRKEKNYLIISKSICDISISPLIWIIQALRLMGLHPPPQAGLANL
jgi:hypothetical protein